MNLRDAFDRVLLADQATDLDLDYLSDLHKVLMAGSLPTSELGLARNSGVRIGGTSYSPPADLARLREEIKFIPPQASQYTDPFERGIYLHCNLAYLQYFRDGNKRTARMMQTAALAQGGVLPLFFDHRLIDNYTRSVVSYYETGSYGPYVDFFKENYRMTAAELEGCADKGADSTPGQK